MITSSDPRLTYSDLQWPTVTYCDLELPTVTYCDLELPTVTYSDLQWSTMTYSDPKVTYVDPKHLLLPLPTSPDP